MQIEAWTCFSLRRIERSKYFRETKRPFNASINIMTKLDKTTIKIFSLIFMLLFLYQTGFSQPPIESKLQNIRKDLKAKIEKKEIASIAIAVIKDNKIIWKETLGWEDRERKIKATAKTIYPLASLSKSITATGIWVLGEKGKLSIDDSVETHLKSADLTYFQGTSEDLKIKHLLNMAGGIPHQYEYFYDQDKESRPTLLEQIRRYGFVAFPPGNVHNYSNFSYAILDQLITDVSGKSFEKFMQKALFKPLGMKRTFTERPANKAIAIGYDDAGSPVSPNIFEPRGGAGMYSTLDDLIKYGFVHLNEKNFLKAETLDKAHRSNPNSANPYYSSGWGVLPTSDGRVALLSNGAIAGTATTLFLVPKDDLIIACLTNTTVGNDFTDSLAFEIAGILLDGYSESLQSLFEEVGPLFAEIPFVADESYVGDWEGNIKTKQGDFPIRITFKSGARISVSMEDQTEKFVEKPYLENGLLNGSFDGTISTKETLRKPHKISFTLMRERNKLFGVATAQSTSKQTKFYLPYYIELTRNQ